MKRNSRSLAAGGNLKKNPSSKCLGAYLLTLLGAGATPELSTASEIRQHGAESAYAGLSKAFPIKNRPVPLPKDLIDNVEIN